MLVSYYECLAEGRSCRRIPKHPGAEQGGITSSSGVRVRYNRFMRGLAFPATSGRMALLLECSCTEP